MSLQLAFREFFRIAEVCRSDPSSAGLGELGRTGFGVPAPGHGRCREVSVAAPGPASRRRGSDGGRRGRSAHRSVLADHATTQGKCHFAVWSGWSPFSTTAQFQQIDGALEPIPYSRAEMAVRGFAAECATHRWWGGCDPTEPTVVVARRPGLVRGHRDRRSVDIHWRNTEARRRRDRANPPRGGGVRGQRFVAS